MQIFRKLVASKKTSTATKSRAYATSLINSVQVTVKWRLDSKLPKNLLKQTVSKSTKTLAKNPLNGKNPIKQATVNLSLRTSIKTSRKNLSKAF